MATFTTARGFFNLTAANTSMVDWDFANFIDYDDETRFDLATFMMLKGNTKEVGTPEFLAWAGELNPRTGAISDTTALAAADVVMEVASTDGVRVDDVLHIPSEGNDGEHVRVTAIGAASFTVVRMNETPVTIATASAFVILGSASSEVASTSIQSTWMEPTKVTNRVQLIRRSFELSRTEMATDVQTAQSRLQQKTEQARLDFRLDLGHVMWFSISSTDSTNAYLTSKGIIAQLANGSGVTSISSVGAMAYADYAALAEGLALYSKSGDYMVFHGTKLLGGLAELGASSSFFRTAPNDTVFGFKGTSVQLSHGFRFMHKFERLFDVIGAPYDGYAVWLDMDALTLHHMKGQKFEFKANIHDDPGGEIVKSQYRAQLGLGITWPKRHGYASGIT